MERQRSLCLVCTKRLDDSRDTLVVATEVIDPLNDSPRVIICSHSSFNNRPNDLPSAVLELASSSLSCRKVARGLVITNTSDPFIPHLVQRS